MLKSRLETISRDLVSQIEKASDVQKRAIAAAIASLAVGRSGLDDPTVDMGVRAVKTGTYGPGPISSDLERIVEGLDNQYFKAQELFEAGRSDKAAYQELFAKARAASAVLCALDKDSFHAASEATYEAISAIGIEEPVSVVNEVLSQ